MKELIDASCPLCGKPSVYYEIDFGERHYYKCATCTKFIITRRAEELIRQGAMANVRYSTEAAAATAGNDEQVIEIAYGLGDLEHPGISVKVVNKRDYPGI